MKIHVEVWVASRILGADGRTFSKDELLAFIREKFRDSRRGLSTHISSYCVASTRANPGRYRYLTAVGRGLYRVYRPGDPVHPTKMQAPMHPDPEDVPPEYRYLLSQADTDAPPLEPALRTEAPSAGAPTQVAQPGPNPAATEELSISLHYAWRPVENKSGAPYLYPDGSGIAAERDGPAVYRWVIYEKQPGDLKRLYIGEAELLSRRVYGYLNPGPSQQTNIRLKARFEEEMKADNKVTLETLEFEPFDMAGVSISMQDLADKRVRRFLEGLFTLLYSRSGYTVLNA